MVSDYTWVDINHWQRYEKSSAEQKNLVLFYAETKNLRHAVAKIGKKLRHDEDLHNLFYSGMKKTVQFRPTSALKVK